MHAAVHAHQPMSTLPVDFHINLITDMDSAQILGFEEMNYIVAIFGEARIDHPVLTFVNHQAPGIPRLSAAQRVKYGRREDHTMVENFDHLTAVCFLVAVLVKYFFCHRLALYIVRTIILT
jgi:hypothetical protein